MKLLYYDKDISGHHLEYVHHLYVGMASRTDCQYVFVLPEEFQAVKSKYEWPEASNICFDFLTQEELNAAASDSILKTAWCHTKLIRRKVRKHSPDSIFFASLIDFFPFVLFSLPSGVKISGIVYQIYLYKWRRMGWLGKIKNACIFKMLSVGRSVENIYILNDEAAALRLNKIYATTIFKSLTDPFNEIAYQPNNLRQELALDSNVRIFLHFGGLTKRKGTIKLLEAISEIKPADRKNIAFVFAGRVYSDIHDEFYRLVNKLESTIIIKVYDYFCSNEQLADLCHTTDFIVIPYESECQSSGLIGYAAFYNKPVIGPAGGLLGKIIRKNKLGITLPDITPSSLAETIAGAKPFQINSHYKEIIKKEQFVEKILAR